MYRFRSALLAMVALGVGVAARSQSAFAPLVAEQEVGGLPVRLNLVASPSYGSGETVWLKLFLKNVSDRPLALRIPHDEVSYSILVQDGRGGSVTSCEGGELDARYSPGRVLTLAPGQAWLFDCEWPQWGPGLKAVPRGVYIVSASLWVNEQSLRSTSRRITLR